MQGHTRTKFFQKGIRFFFVLLSFLQVSLQGQDVDYDYVVVGSSPICLLEALYHSYAGARVLIVERESKIGGAWQTIDICQIPDVDMGCHELSLKPDTKDFLEKYVGCTFVSMYNPYNQMHIPESDSKDVYFSEGCHELLSHIHALLQKSTVTLVLNQKLEKVNLDFNRERIEITTSTGDFLASKLIITPRSVFKIQNYPNFVNTWSHKSKHIYVLVEDPSLPCFTYQNGFCKGISRVMNVTPFSPSLKGTGHQLIAIQTYDDKPEERLHFYLEEMKKKKWLNEQSRILEQGMYVYEQINFNTSVFTNEHPEAAPYFEILHYEHITDMEKYVKKWETLFTPWYGSE